MRNVTRHPKLLPALIVGAALCLLLLLKLLPASLRHYNADNLEITRVTLTKENPPEIPAEGNFEAASRLTSPDGDAAPGTGAVSNMLSRDEVPLVAVSTPAKDAGQVQTSNGFSAPVAAGTGDTSDKSTNSYKWVWIAPGSFVMGSPQTEAGRRPNEGPQTVVTLTHGFWFGEHEVTLREFLDVTGHPPKRPYPHLAPHLGSDPDRAFANASWAEAMKFCAAITERERKAGRLPDGYVCRLPTEAEWEYACRAGTSGSFSFGNGEDAALLNEFEWYKANSGGAPQQVAAKRPNPWGLFDMHGNVSEWCLDYLGDYPGGSVTNPVGVIAAGFFIVRGGSWNFPAEGCRSARRHWVNNGYKNGDKNGHIESGFRVALALPLRLESHEAK